MKDFKKQKTIILPIYPFQVHFLLLDKGGEKYIESKNSGSDARTERDGQDIFICIRDKAPLHTIVHELFHATEFIMEKVGQKMSDSPNESYAYLIDYLAAECFKFLKI